MEPELQKEEQSLLRSINRTMEVLKKSLDEVVRTMGLQLPDLHPEPEA